MYSTIKRGETHIGFAPIRSFNDEFGGSLSRLSKQKFILKIGEEFFDLRLRLIILKAKE